MSRLRKIKNYGSAGWKVNLVKTDVEDLGIKDGDYINIDDCIIISEKLRKVKYEK